MSFDTVQRSAVHVGAMPPSRAAWAPTLAGIFATLGFDLAGMRPDTFFMPGCSGGLACEALSSLAPGSETAAKGGT